MFNRYYLIYLYSIGICVETDINDPTGVPKYVGNTRDSLFCFTGTTLADRPIDSKASPFETLLPLPGTHRWLAPSPRLFYVCSSSPLHLFYVCRLSSSVCPTSVLLLSVCSSASVLLLLCSPFIYPERRLTSGPSANRYTSIRFGQIISSLRQELPTWPLTWVQLSNLRAP